MSDHEQALRGTWVELAGDSHDHLFENLLTSYREEHRHYHTEAHVARVLRHVEAISLADGQPPNPSVVKLAALYHDAIYQPVANDNEALSASLCSTVAAELGWSPADAELAARLIRATAGHHATNTDEAVLIDADLAILGAPRDDYADYVRAVRSEFVDVDDDSWKAGRAAVLRQFLAQPFIFSTTCMRRTREQQARTNIESELRALAVSAGNGPDQ